MGRDLLDQWQTSSSGQPRFALPGSGSDFTVFLHHLGLPVIDLGFGGNAGGQYHTAFDDFGMIERFLDPGFVGHEVAGHCLATLLGDLAELGPLCFDDAYAAAELERHARDAAAWLGEERANELAIAFATLSRAIHISWTEWRRTHEFVEQSELGLFGAWPSFLDSLADPANAEAWAAARAEQRPSFYGSLLVKEGLQGRPWFKNDLWAPDPNNGYGTQPFPTLRILVDAGDEAAVDAALVVLIARIGRLREAWDARAQASRDAGKR